MKHLDEYWAYVHERWMIRQRRLAGQPWPWTDDPILRQYSFTNVKREWDRTTEWLVANWYAPNKDHPMLPVACALARQLGRRETLAAIGFPARWEPDALIAALRRIRDSGGKVYTGAYMITAIGMMTRACEDKIEYTVRHVVGPLVGQRVAGKDVQETVGLLTSFHGWAGFMAQEAALDMALAGVVAPSPDWAHAGPGAKRGLNRIAGREAKAGLADKQALEEMRFIRDSQPASIGFEVTAHDVEFSCCEFDKYMRTKLGEGRPRNHYKGAKG